MNENNEIGSQEGGISHGEAASAAPQEEDQELLEQRFADLAKEYAREIYEVYRRDGKSPQEILQGFIDDPDGRYVYGDEVIEGLAAEIPNLPREPEEVFVEAYARMMLPFYRSLTDPAVRERKLECMKKRADMAGVFNCTVGKAEENFVFEGRAESIKKGEGTVMRIDMSTVPADFGKHAIEDSLRAVAQKLEEDPSILAVVSVSWLFGHPLAKRFGFEVLSIPVGEDEVRGSANTGRVGRVTKATFDRVGTYEVRWGGMSREKFLSLYGSK